MRDVMTLEISVTKEGRFAMEGAGMFLVPMPFSVQRSMEDATSSMNVHLMTLQGMLRRAKELGGYDDEHPVSAMLEQADALVRHRDMLASILASGIIVPLDGAKNEQSNFKGR